MRNLEREISYFTGHRLAVSGMLTHGCRFSDSQIFKYSKLCRADYCTCLGIVNVRLSGISESERSAALAITPRQLFEAAAYI